MNNTRLFLTKALIALIFFFITGVPFLWLHRMFLPSHLYIITSIVLIVVFSVYWQDFRLLKKGVKIWIMALIILLVSMFRKNLLPPFVFKIYDLFLIFVILSILFEDSKIKKLLVFTAILISPMALAELYGLFPSCTLNGALLLIGFLGGIFLPGFYAALLPKGDRGRICANGTDKILLLGLMLLIFALSLSIFIFPRGTLKKKRVVFDVGHGSTESPQGAYSLDITNSLSFGHGRLADILIKNDFEVFFYDKITGNILRNADILVIIMSCVAYTREEIRAIKEFVLNGGGLLVIGDHTDINNVSSAMNPVIEQFGIRFLFDTVWLQTNERIDLRYRPHPIHFDLKRVNFSVGASLGVKPPARSVIRAGYVIYSDYGDANRADNGYLGNAKLDGNERINDLTLVAESEYGKGRVLVLGDSAYFQNVSIYQNHLLALRVFDWLNCSTENRGCRRICVGILLALALIIFMFILYRGRIGSDILFVSLCLSIIISLWIGGIINLRRFPSPKEPENTILIDLAHHNEYGTYWTTRADPEVSLDGFVAQIIRLDYQPVIKTSGRITYDELKRHRAFFVICPNIRYTQDEIEAVARFCEEGGGLLLVEGGRKWACSSMLWERFDLRKERYPLSADFPVLSPYGLPIRLPYGDFKAEFVLHPITMGLFGGIKMVNPCRVRGGVPIAFINSQAVVSFTDFGRGRVLAVADDRVFASYMVEKDTKIIDPMKLRFIWNIINYLSNG